LVKKKISPRKAQRSAFLGKGLPRRKGDPATKKAKREKKDKKGPKTPEKRNANIFKGTPAPEGMSGERKEEKQKNGHENHKT